MKLILLFLFLFQFLFQVEGSPYYSEETSNQTELEVSFENEAKENKFHIDFDVHFFPAFKNTCHQSETIEFYSFSSKLNLVSHLLFKSSLIPNAPPQVMI